MAQFGAGRPPYTLKDAMMGGRASALAGGPDVPPPPPGFVPVGSLPAPSTPGVPLDPFSPSIRIGDQRGSAPAPNPVAAPAPVADAEPWYPIYSQLKANPLVLKSTQLPRDPVAREQALRAAAQSVYFKTTPGAQFGQDFSESINRQGGWGLSDDTRKMLGADSPTRNDGSITSTLRSYIPAPIRNAPATLADLAFRGFQGAQGGIEAGAVGFDRSLDETGLPGFIQNLTGNKFEPGHGLLALMEGIPDGGANMGFVAPKLETLPAAVRAGLNDEATALFAKGATRGEIDAWASSKGLAPYGKELDDAIAARDAAKAPAQPTDAPLAADPAARSPDYLSLPPSNPAPGIPTTVPPLDTARPRTLADLLQTQTRAPDWLDSRAAMPNGPAVEGPAPISSRYTPPPPPPGFYPIDSFGAAMRSEFDAPTLVGPRVVDRIDVGKPVSMLADQTDYSRLRAAGRLDPGDVTPIPANTVSGLDEAMGIERGRFEPIKATDERSALDTRNLPSPVDGLRTLPKKGPLDLVTWLRSQGGLKPVGGELDWSGITNAPRAGMDFAGGEHRFGKLIDPEQGMSYDQAAERAWEAGYFPERAEPPTGFEFLDALKDTHTGSNRRFHPDDIPEIDNFNALRDQRYAVEAAADRGEPLTRDNSSPATLADLEANTAPVTAWEDAGVNAPRYAGNIDLSKLDSPQSIARALSQVERVSGGFDAATRGTISHAETTALAADLGMTPERLLARRKGQAFNAEEALAARQILAKSGNELVNRARRIQTGNATERELATWREAVVRHAAIQEQVSGITAEAGRTLSSLRAGADSRAVRGDVLKSLIDAGGGEDGIRAAADMIIDAADDPARLNAVVEAVSSPKLKDKLIEVWYNFLLSGPRTHAVNITSNLLTSMASIPEHTIAAGIGAARKVLPGQELTDRVLFSETGARVVGSIQGAQEGFREFARTMRTGQSSDFASKVEAQSQRAIGGLKGDILRLPTRALSAEDEFFKAMARRQEVVGLSLRRAASEGLKGKALKDRAAELAANPTPDILDAASDYARYLTFQRPLGAAGQSVINMTQKLPALKLFVPFVRTPMNLLKFAIERAPTAPLLKEWRADVMAGGARRDLALARATVGTSAIMLAVEAARKGLLTGGGPADDSAKRLQVADGWQPYSVKVGDKYYSYNRLDPFSTTLGMAADWVDLQSHMTEKQQQDVAGLLVATTLSNLSDKTWLSGISNLTEALNDPERYGQNFVSGLVASAVPALAAQTAQAIDPVQRDAQTVLDRIRSRIPFASKSLPARRDILGKPLPAGNGGGLAAFSPVYTSTEGKDLIARTLLNNGVSVGSPSRTIGDPLHKGAKVKLDARQYEKYQTDAGALIRRQIGDVILTPEWGSMGREDREDLAKKIIASSRKTARTGLFGGQSAPPAALPPPPPGFVPAPPPPPGFVPMTLGDSVKMIGSR